MTWVKVDDGITEHPKCVGLTPYAWTLWLHGLTYSSRNLTDGHIPAAMLPRLCALRDPQKTAAELVDAGLWDTCEGGWTIHDYADHQRTRQDVEKVRESARERGKRGRTKQLARGTFAEPSREHRANIATPSREPRGPESESESETDHHPDSVVSSGELSTGAVDDDDSLRRITNHVEQWARAQGKRNPSGYAQAVVARDGHELAGLHGDALTAEMHLRWPAPPPVTPIDAHFLPGTGVITRPTGDPTERLSPTAQAALAQLDDR